MTRTRGHGPQRDQAQAAQEQNERARLDDVYRAILARTPEHDLTPSLDRIAALCQLLGDPQRTFEVVHLTGTNGKTSTTRITERLLREHGLRTGRFTSPHLNDVRERITVDGELIGAQRFIDVYAEIQPYLELVDQRSAAAGEPRLSYFEVLVAMAYAAFADTPVDVATVEVGLGGIWDATNVADGKVAVVTPIALDHQRFLGYDVESIAREKAGIIKPGATAVLADQPEEAMQVLLARAAQVDARVLRAGYDFGVASREVALGGQLLTIQGVAGPYEELFLPLHGEYQAHNAALAVAATEAFLGADHLDADVVRAALADVRSPGRLEVVRRSPTVLVDAAHNPAGIAAMAQSLEEAFGFSTLIGLVAIFEDKDPEVMLGALEPVLTEVVITRTSSPRCMDPDELGEIAQDVFGEERVRIVQRLDDALDQAMGLAEEGGLIGGGVLATGSVTMAADVRLLLGVHTT